MRQSPKWTQFHRYPVVAGTALVATGVTLAWWGKADISPLVENAMIRRGELWRLATSMLPHVGLMHLAFNLYWLWIFGTLVEEIFGHVKTAALILLFGMASGAFEYAFLFGGVWGSPARGTGSSGCCGSSRVATRASTTPLIAARPGFLSSGFSSALCSLGVGPCRLEMSPTARER